MSDTSLDSLRRNKQVSTRLWCAVKNLGIESLDELAEVPLSTLQKGKNIGKLTIAEISDVLDSHGYDYSWKVDHESYQHAIKRIKAAHRQRERTLLDKIAELKDVIRAAKSMLRFSPKI